MCTPNGASAWAAALPRAAPVARIAPLPGPLDPQRVQRRGGVLCDHRLNVGNVGAGRKKVVHQRSRQELSAAVVDQFLQQRAADSLHRAANGLSVHGEGVDAAAHVLHHHVSAAPRACRFPGPRPREPRGCRRSRSTPRCGNTRWHPARYRGRRNAVATRPALPPAAASVVWHRPERLGYNHAMPQVQRLRLGV